MASAAPPRLHPIVRDRLFFFVMALVIAATAVSGFSLQLAMGRSTFHSPWWVHVHGITFMGWLGLYLVQNWLAWRGDIVDHQRLGRFAVFYVGWMVLVGISVNALSALNHRLPSFAEPNVFLTMDWVIIAVFAGLTWAAVRLRGASDWHRRLMLCGAIQVMVPGLARLLPLPLFGSWLLWAIWAALLPFTAAALVYDLRTRGKVHAAYYWGFGAILVGVVLVRPIAFSPPMLALVHQLTT